MSDEKLIPISEIFGPTLQGEGSLVGRPTIFVRVGGCDFMCSWCDSLYAVLPEHRHTWTKMNSEEILNEIKKLSSKPVLVTLSGGNPALYDFSELIDVGHKEGYTFTIETQGSIPAKWMDKLDSITLSPKPPSSNMKFDENKFRETIINIKDVSKITLKVVVSDLNDYKFAVKIFEMYSDFKLIKCITPCNVSPGDPDLDLIYEKTRHVADLVINDCLFDVAVIPQMHVLLWGNTRGK